MDIDLVNQTVAMMNPQEQVVAEQIAQPLIREASKLSDEEFIGYLRGNIAKYMHRWRYKNGIEDLQKAQWYNNRLIKFYMDRVLSLTKDKQ